MRSICIYASQLASCIGYNRFKKQCDALESVWQRVDSESFFHALRRNGIKTQEEAVRDIMTSNDMVRTVLVQAEDAVVQSTTSNDVARGYEEAAAKLATAQLKYDDRRIVDDTVRKALYTSFGNQREKAALEHVQSTTPCHTDDTFYRTHITDAAGVTVFVGGKLDALSDDGTTIIELKNRINRLFYKIPMYEIVQCQAYIHVVPTAERARLVECLTRDDGTILTNSVAIERDDHLWSEDVVPALATFVSVLVHVLNDVGLQDAYLQSRHRQSFFTSLANVIKGDGSERWRCLQEIA